MAISRPAPAVPHVVSPATPAAASPPVTPALTPPTTSADAPRVSPGSARSLLLTLLGEFVLPARAPTWTSTLLYALHGVGVAEKSGRQAIARAAAAGWIESSRDGRRASWQLTGRGRTLISEGSLRLRSLRAAADAWDGHWLLLHISLPDARRADRLRLYRALSWIGFGNPTPGLWINPHSERAGEARRVVEDLKLDARSFAFRSTALQFGISERELVAQSWDLPTIAAHYTGLVAYFSALRPQSPDANLFAHIELVNALQRLPFIDPALPAALLPPGWPAARAAAKLETMRMRWRDAAHQRWRELPEGGDG